MTEFLVNKFIKDVPISKAQKSELAMVCLPALLGFFAMSCFFL